MLKSKIAQSLLSVQEPVMAPITRILVVDDHGIVRAGIATLLELDHSLKVVGSAASGEDAILATRRLKPDVVVMDLMLPGLNGIEATALILAQSPDTLIIVLSSSRAPGHVQRALQAGARGYVLKSAESIELIDAIKAVIAGGEYISPEIATSTGMSRLASAQEMAFDLLSARERDVLRRVVAGYTSADIGRQLSLSRKTIETYRSRLMVKLCVKDRAELIRMSMKFDVPLV